MIDDNRDRSLVEWLGRTSLFAGMAEAHLRELSGIAMVVSYRKRTTIFSAGDQGNGFYLVKEGKVKIYMISPEGKEQILHIFGSGEPFGEVPVFAGKSFPAHAVALEDCRLIFLPRDDFVALVAANPALALNLLAALAARLRQFTKMIDALSLKEVPGRLAAHLLFLSEKQLAGDNLQLELSKTQLASLLGTIPETLSRMLSKLQREGFIRIDGAKILISDRAGLAALAEIGKF
ncbi:MAG: Crp/Fnr family transcriptional regulator [Deltaproteobacteria bacterium]|nr:Crp/Fnr family transcriptional regulator [Deltaproteobacteria bacterium]